MDLRDRLNSEYVSRLRFENTYLGGPGQERALALQSGRAISQLRALLDDPRYPRNKGGYRDGAVLRNWRPVGRGGSEKLEKTWMGHLLIREALGNVHGKNIAVRTSP